MTVYERANRPGGLLMYGIPNMKLEKESVVLRRLNVLEAEGITFVCNTEIGKDYPADATAPGLRCRRPLHWRHQAPRLADPRT